MPTDTLYAYSGTPWGAGTQVDYIDLYEGDGLTTDFDLLNKTGPKMASTLEVDNQQFFRSLDGYTLVGNTFSTATAPLSGAIILAPGMGDIILRAFDTQPIPGNATARTAVVPFWLADITNIQFFLYEKVPGSDGIKLAFYDTMPLIGPSADWFSFAPALADGTAGTYEAAGDPLFTSDISAFDFLDADITMAGTDVEVPDGSLFTEGDYIVINPQGLNRETVHIASIAGDTLITDGTELIHEEGEPVITNGRKFYMKVVVPEGANAGVARNMYGIALELEYTYASR